MDKDDRDATKAQMMEELQALRAEVSALREHCAISESVIEAVPDAAFVKDLRGRYVMMNTAGARLLGKPASELLGKEDSELFSPDQRPTVRSGRPQDHRRGDGQDLRGDRGDSGGHADLLDDQGTVRGRAGPDRRHHRHRTRRHRG